MPLFDVSTFDASQNAMNLVSEELLRKHNVLPLFKRGGKLFVGTSNPTHALDEIKFHTNLVVEPIRSMRTRSAARWNSGTPAMTPSATRWAATTRAWPTSMSAWATTKARAPTPASTPRATTPR